MLNPGSSTCSSEPVRRLPSPRQATPLPGQGSGPAAATPSPAEGSHGSVQSAVKVQVQPASALAQFHPLFLQKEVRMAMLGMATGPEFPCPPPGHLRLLTPQWLCLAYSLLCIVQSPEPPRHVPLGGQGLCRSWNTLLACHA